MPAEWKAKGAKESKQRACRTTTATPGRSCWSRIAPHALRALHGEQVAEADRRALRREAGLGHVLAGRHPLRGAGVAIADDGALCLRGVDLEGGAIEARRIEEHVDDVLRPAVAGV